MRVRCQISSDIKATSVLLSSCSSKIQRILSCLHHKRIFQCIRHHRKCSSPCKKWKSPSQFLHSNQVTTRPISLASKITHQSKKRKSPSQFLHSNQVTTHPISLASKITHQTKDFQRRAAFLVKIKRLLSNRPLPCAYKKNLKETMISLGCNRYHPKWHSLNSNQEKSKMT